MAAKRVWLLLTIAGLLLAACGSTVTGSLAPPGTPTEGTAVVPQEAEEIVSAIEQDLAEQLNIETDQIQIVSVEAVEWPDASLGCPQPGMMYAQMITPGYRVELQAEGKTYVYHTGPGGFVRCEEEQRFEEPAKDLRLEPETSALVEQARSDLSKMLGVALDEITVLSIKEVQWPDSSLGCPQPGMSYLTVVTPGYEILLQVGDKTYSYHADRKRAIYCPQEEKGTVDSQQLALNAALSDLAQKLDIPVDSITVEKIETVEWPDASLGCAKPGRMYAQVITPGYLIVLSAQGQEYEYHTDRVQAILCQR